MEIQEIKDLLAQFDQSTLTEFDLKDGSFGLYFNKNQECHNSGTSQSVTPQAGIKEVSETITPVPVAKKTLSNESLPSKEEPEETGTKIVSPVVGIVYLKPAPDKAEFKKVGDRVEKGEVVCIVEAMKVMNEITADVAGVVTGVLVENEQVVEFNQALFTVKEG